MRKTILAVSILAILVTMSSFLIVMVDKALFWRSELNAIMEQASSTPPITHTKKPCILFIGDSIWASFPLKAMFPQLFTVVNKGVSGNSIKQIAERYHKEVTNTPHDIVVIEGGINDILGCIVNNRNENDTFKYIIKAYGDVLSTARDNGKAVVISAILPVTHKFLLPYRRLLSLPTEFDVSRINRLVRMVNAELRNIAVENQVQFCDVHRVTVGHNGEFQRSLAAADGYHVNVFGYKVISDALTPCLMRLCR